MTSETMDTTDLVKALRQHLRLTTLKIGKSFLRRTESGR